MSNDPTQFAFKNNDTGNLILFIKNGDDRGVTFGTYRALDKRITIKVLTKEEGNELYKLHKNNNNFRACGDRKVLALIRIELEGLNRFTIETSSDGDAIPIPMGFRRVNIPDGQIQDDFFIPTTLKALNMREITQAERLSIISSSEARAWTAEAIRKDGGEASFNRKNRARIIEVRIKLATGNQYGIPDKNLISSNQTKMIEEFNQSELSPEEFYEKISIK